MSKNQHIIDFLDYYCKLENPEYAVLLEGSWGAGKTWFINNYIQTKSLQTNDFLSKFKPKLTKSEYIYISLYGIKSIAQIEYIFLQQFLPSLQYKLINAAKDFGKVTAKGFRINLSGDEIKFSEYFNPKKHILIFDDLERCQLPIKEILGYINAFIEHKKFRVIILADENKISTNEKSIYDDIKEKSIGKTFEITPDIKAALNTFIGQLSENKQVQSFLTSNISSIIEIYTQANYNNLRHLKQALFDFERFFNGLPDDAKEKKDLLLHLLTVLLIYAIEIKAGLSVKSFRGYSMLSEKEEHKPLKKYNPYYLTSPISGDCLIDFLDKGIINKEAIKESIHNSRYYDTRPDWVKLWRFMDLPDEEFETLLSKIETEYNNKKYEDIGIVLHIISLFLALSDIGLYSKEKKDIFEYGKQYIDYLKNNQKSIDFEFFPFPDSYAGLGFHARELTESKELLDYLKQKIEEIKTENLPQEAGILLDLMKTNTKKFFQMLILLTSTSENPYSRIPILKYIQPEDFVSSYLSVKPENQETVIQTMVHRYQHDKKDLMSELDWLKEVRKILPKHINDKPSGYRVQLFIQVIDKNIKELEATQ